jgi:predicted Zn-dependent peptidase
MFYLRSMISYSRFTLENGLKVIVHEDPSTPLACINILYDVPAMNIPNKPDLLIYSNT